MAGHSQFKNIMHRKGAQDAKRAKIFNKLAREVTVAVKEGGGADPTSNSRLRAAIIAARGANMPKDRIERAMGAASTDAADWSEMRYEGYGPGGVAVIVEALTDNRNRTASEVRSTFGKHGGSMGEAGSVGFMFNHIGEISYPASVANADTMFEAGVEAGADNVESDDEQHIISTSVTDFASVRDALGERYGDPSQARLSWRPTNTNPVNEQQARTLLKMIDVLEDNDDVQAVFVNFEISDDIMAKLANG